MRLIVKLDPGAVEHAQEVIQQAIDTAIPKILPELAALYMELQRQRVARGQDLDGAAFKPYTPEYRMQKEQSGRMGVNAWLRLTGEMLRSQIVKYESTPGGGHRAIVEFDGMHAPVSFTPRARKFKNKKTGKTYTHTVKPRAGGKMSSNAIIAAANDDTRPFVGLSREDADRIEEVCLRRIGEEVRCALGG